MMFDVATKTTDIIMFNSRNLGALIVDEKPHVKSWDEPQYSIHNLGIEESYGFGVLNEGQAIAVAKNVKVRQNEMSTPEALIISIGSTLRSSSLLLDSSVALPSMSTTTTTTSRLSRSSANNSLNRCPRDDAELRSAAGDSRPGRRIASVDADLRRSHPGPGLVRIQSLTGKSLEAFRTYDNMPRWLPTLPGLLP
jgi:hypothetical protein